RATEDVDLATATDPYTGLTKLEHALQGLGFRTRLRFPDEHDALGGVLRVWEHEDDDDDPIDYVEVVNFSNPHRPALTPAADAIRNAVPIDDRSPIRVARLPDL